MAKRGAKGKYDTHVKPRLLTIKAWKRKGLTDEEIWNKLGISRDSFYSYKLKYSEFSDVLKGGLDDFLSEVEESHYKMANGFEYEETKVIYDTDDEGHPLRVSKIEKTKKFVIPNVTAQIHIMKNRAAKYWHDRKELEIYGKDGKEMNFRVTIEKDDSE